MKQKFTFFAIVMMAMAIPQSVKAYDFYAVSPSGQTLYYNYLDNGVEVTCPASYGYDGFTEPTGMLVIPDSVNDGIGNMYAVVAIGDAAFINCINLTSVTVPNTVTAIKSNAFFSCRNLQTALLSDSLQTIGSAAFYGCSHLVGFVLPANVSAVESNAFEEVNNVIYNGELSIRDQWSWTYIGSAKMINGYVENDIVYYDATKTMIMGWEGVVTNVVIPSSVTTINHMAFNHCDSLESITIPSSVIYIEDEAFMMCEQLVNVYYLGTMSDWCNIAFGYMLGSNPGRNTNLYINGSLVTDIAIPEGITVIKQNAFEGIGTSVTFPSTLSRIESRAFSGSNITHLSIPESVSFVGDEAFAECFYLQDVKFEGQSTTIGSSAFMTCPNLHSITLPAGLTSISSYTFYGCTRLDSVLLPAFVTSIEYDAFGACDSLKTMFFNAANCTTSFDIWGYSSNHFSITHPLRTLYLGPTVESIPDGAFANNNLLESIFAESTTPPTLGSGVFSNVASFNVYIPCGSYDNYLAEWGNMDFREPKVDINIVVDVNDINSGSAEVVVDRYGNNVRCDSTTIISATPFYGHHFSHWSNGRTDNPITIALSSDTSLVAYFESDEFTLIVLPNDSTLGSVFGSGIYLNGSTVTITAIPSQGNRFDRWSDNTLLVSKTFTITKDTTFVGVFVPVDTIHVHDTIISTLFDTVINIVYDTVSEIIHDTIINNIYIHDTTTQLIHDTTYLPVYVYDTVLEFVVDTIYLPQYIHDTMYIYDTVYVGVDEVETISAKIYTSNGQIVVDGAQGNTVWLYDINGRVLATKQDEYLPLRFDVLASGVYLVKIGNYPARRVVVVR